MQELVILGIAGLLFEALKLWSPMQVAIGCAIALPAIAILSRVVRFILTRKHMEARQGLPTTLQALSDPPAYSPFTATTRPSGMGSQTRHR